MNSNYTTTKNKLHFSSSFAKVIALTLLAIYFRPQTQAQDNFEGTGLKNYFFVGGGVGLQFGSETNIEASPSFGYHFSNLLSAGIGGSYQYYSIRNSGFRLNIYGGRVFLRAQPLRPFFAHLEYEILTYYTNIYSPINQYEHVISENLLGGVGYREYFSEQFSYYIMLLYNFNYNIYTPYSNPVFRVGVEFAFPASKK
ncbi:MAG: hypothetical protein CVU11_11685 [Bacteroidetes bacterium HGW-Bacteroidetes-6]|jgi:hypothetical protein|nr:MAG: hypothetical protein CVU11_11685 [Bacteroidetes bacterium HGW-Bacteroidetes-6]